MTPGEPIVDDLSKYARSALDNDPERTATSQRLAEAMFGLFIGRSDAYSIRKVFTDGRPKAYYPNCAQKFKDGCQISKGKGSPCDDCAARKLNPLTVDVFRRHVLGEHSIGLYLISDARVRCAAVDFDDHGDVKAETAPAPEDMPIPRGARLVEAGRSVGIPLFMERSQSGRGVHVWVFFRDWVTANYARKLFELLLRRANLPTDVEVFPRQRDARKFGNLIAVPYSDGPDRWRQGRSVFIDSDSFEILDPLQALAEASDSLVSEMQVMRVRKEYKIEDEPDPSSTPSEPLKGATTATLVEGPIGAIYDGCAALRRLRDDPPYPEHRHGRGHYQRLALASAFRLLPSGREEVHRLLAEKCGDDYSPRTTDSKIDSLNHPPITCMRMRTWGICKLTEACAIIKDRGGKSPVVFAYTRGGAPENVEDGRVEIRITTDQAAMYDAALEALTGHPELYQRGGLLVHVVAGTKSGSPIKREADAPRVEYVPKAWIERSLSDVAQFMKHKGKSGWVAADPASTVVEQLLTPRYLTGIRFLMGLTETPQQRHDGTIITAPGYDVRTGLVHCPYDELLEVPEKPTREDALAARDLLIACTDDFPIETEAHRAAWLSMILTYFARPAIDGAIPLFVIDANTRGAGKSLLAQVASIIMTGREAATINWSGDDRENKKALTALFIAADPVILFDNVDTMLGGSALNSALTSTVWKDRILGESRDTGRMPIRSLLMATSNNATFGKDTIRRTIHVRLESPYEHPEDRDDYQHPKIRDEIRANRPRLVQAALTILRAFNLSGERPKLRGMGDYGAWSQIRQAVVWLGMPDPLSTQKVLAEHADQDSNELRSLLDAMKQVNPDGEWLTAGEFLERAASAGPGFATAMGWNGVALRNVLLEHCATKSGELPSVMRFAGRLCHFRNRIAGGEAIVNMKNVDTNGSVWRVATTDKQVDGNA